jgi:hypothetical protein
MFSKSRFAQPSTMFAGTDREDLRIWFVREYISSFGKIFEAAKTSIARRYEIWDALRSL